MINDEKNLAHYSKINNERIKTLIENNMPTLKFIEVMMLEIAERTHDGDLEDACAFYFDDVMPVFKEYSRSI